MTAPRVRFAPAPTGFLHVGSARSALFNWLHARHTGGTMVLRIEDTDASKKTDEFVDAILEPLKWLGIDWDEGPFFQSDRAELHKAAVQQLVDNGSAYFCDLTREQIDAKSDEAGLPAGYHGWSRDREVADGPDVVVRFRAPNEGVTIFDDVIRGRVEVAHENVEDFVIRRGDGSPTFLIANAVDDHDMSISHVIRGEDLLNTVPKVLMLWDALGYGEPPIYAHLPLLVNEQRKKLSKRRDDVALGEFASKGYLPEAMVNSLALLGWGPSDEVEVRPIAEIIDLFTLETVNKSAAFFDMKKLDHINAEYIKALDAAQFVELVEPHMTGDDAPWPIEAYRSEVVEALAPEIQQRIATLSEAPSWVSWIFAPAIDSYDEKSWNKAMIKGKASGRVLDEVVSALDAESFDDADALEAAVMGVGNRLTEEMETRVMSQAPVRVALTGHSAGIPLWQAMTLLGKDACLDRLRAARARLD
ncbi:MAG: glutamate--tRNA ligase [Acidimicrobiales bacterium]|nr:glutamate--tRNA ligase [Acidimicrobiales bacterium]MDG2218081.1 glutamate--tRNA ligase [Acidimicrobiales bacterium]